MKEPAHYTGFRWLILISAMLGNVAMQVTNLAIAPILPQIAQSLSIDMGAATNLMTAFLFSGAIALFFSGFICDRYGIMIVLVVGSLCAALPAALMPWIGSTYTGVVWVRIFEGLSSGFLLTVTGPIIALWFPSNEKGLASGLMGASISVGSAIGIISGPALFLATGSWRLTSAYLSVFGWIAVAFAVILSFSSKLRVPTSTVSPDGSVTGRKVLKAALSLRATWIGMLTIFFAGWCLQNLYGFTPSFLAADRPLGAGFGPMVSGQLMLTAMFAGIVGPIIGGILTDKVFAGNVKPVSSIGFLLYIGSIYVVQWGFVYVKVPLLVGTLILAGIAVMFVYPLMYVYVAKIYPLQIVGKMTGLWSVFGALGGVIGLFVAATTLGSFGTYSVPITLIAVGGLAGLILSLFLPKPKA